MYGVIAAWIKSTQQSTPSGESLQAISPSSILDSKPIIYALGVLPDSKLIDFMTWFHGRSHKELEAARKLVLNLSEDPVSFFNLLGNQLFDEDELYQNGAIFTPNWLTAALMQKTIEYWRMLNPTRETPTLVGDLSCGPGAFLLELSRELPEAKIVGVDKNPELVCLARLALLGRPRAVIDSKDTLVEIQRQESLFASASNIPSRDYDILIGNPPYIRSQTLFSSYTAQLRQFYPTFTKGNFDLVVLFLAHSLESLAPGGVASLIVSNKFMTSRYGTAICRRLAEQARILEIVNFGDGQVFSNRTTYTCTITFAKVPPAKKFSVTSFPHGLDWRNGTLHFDLAQKADLPYSRLFSHPWDLSSDSSNEILQLLHEPGLPGILGVFRDVSQGIRTGANHIFLVDRKDATSIEAELLQSHINGQNIRRYHILPADRFLLYPYRLSVYGSVEIIPPEVLERDFPVAWSYLLRHRDELEGRKLGPGLPWYSYSRTQNLEIQRYPKILVKEMMPRAEFAADPHGQFSVSAGYALIAPPAMTDCELDLWAAVLSTPTMEFQLRLTGTQLHSGWFRLLGHHLKKIKLPPFQGQALEGAHELAARLRQDFDDTDAWSRLDDLVAQSFKLTPVMQRAIREVLRQAHTVSRPTSESQPELLLDDVDTVDTSYPELSDEQRRLYVPVELPQFNQHHIYREDLRQAVTFVPNKDVPVHNWYNYTQGYSESLVNKLMDELGVNGTDTVYDPFAGCGTTLLTCRTMGIASFGLEISPFMTWVTSLKTSPWSLLRLQEALAALIGAQPDPRPPEQLLFLDYLERAYSPNVLEQLLGWRDWIRAIECEPEVRDFLTLGLVSILEEISYIRKHGSHYRYLNKDEDESVGLKKLNIRLISPDTDIKPIFAKRVAKMIEDTTKISFHRPLAPCEVLLGDARRRLTPLRQADVVITSPPYLNRNNYIAQQKAELSLLGLLPSYDDYRRLVQGTFRSHVESDLGMQPETTIPEVVRILEAFELSPNNNEKIPHMIAGYFEDLKYTLDALFEVVRPGGKLAFVVGNSRWGGVVVPVDHLLALLAERRGFNVERILVTRLKGNSPQQMQRYGRIPVRESIVIFRRPLLRER
jgi:methylase of polypeptide subunit release factors/DNA modification methylase